MYYREVEERKKENLYVHGSLFSNQAKIFASTSHNLSFFYFYNLYLFMYLSSLLLSMHTCKSR